MKKIILFLFIIKLINAQVKHSLNFYAAPEYQSWKYFTDPVSNVPNNFETEFGYNISLNYKMYIKEKFYFLSGVEFNHYLPKINNTGLPVNVDVTKTSFVTNQYILSLGLKGGYHFLNKEKYALGVELGINLRYVAGLNSVQKVVYTDGTPEYNNVIEFQNGFGTTLNRFIVEPIIAIPFHYKLNTNLSLFASPYFGMNIIPLMNYNSPFINYQIYPLRVGAQLGVEYGF